VKDFSIQYPADACPGLVDPAWQVLAWLLGRITGLQLVPPRVVVPLLWGAGPGAGELSTAALTGPSFPGNANADAGGHVSGGASVELRGALEAHYPGSTYAPLLKGRWWKAAQQAAREGRLDALRAGSLPRASDSGGSLTSEEDLRQQLSSCVRVAPGQVFEGFFVASVLKPAA
jgi:hypothetical protein